MVKHGTGDAFKILCCTSLDASILGVGQPAAHGGITFKTTKYSTKSICKMKKQKNYFKIYLFCTFLSHISAKEFRIATCVPVPCLQVRLRDSNWLKIPQ